MKNKWLSYYSPQIITVLDGTPNETQIQTILNLTNVVIVKVLEPEAGDWKTNVQASGDFAIRITG